MKKNVSRKSNNKSKVVSAVAMLMVSVVALSSATYAWFTMSKQVEVDGIELTATAPDNILVSSKIGEKKSGFETIENYANSITLTVSDKEIFKGGTDTAITADDKLFPASSTDGTKLFETSDINVDGSDKGSTTSDYNSAATSTTSTDQYYVDIPLYILTTGSKDVNVDIDEAQSQIKAKDTDNIYKAVRFAVLGADKTNTGGTYEATSTFFGSEFPVSSVSADTKKPTYATKDDAKIVSDGTTTPELDDAHQILLYGTAAEQAKNVSSKYTYTNVVVRVWIEGQNSNCVTENADQTFDVKLVFAKSTTQP